MKQLPIGVSSFEVIRKDKYCYVDKTPFIYKLVKEGKYYFLSRPRRFGKSLFIDTLKQAFLGKKELFIGLYLEKNWDWNTIYPVIHIDFGGSVIQNAEDLKERIHTLLERNQKSLNVICKYKKDFRRNLEELIFQSYKTYNSPVVVLIDEYDKPILDKIEEKDKAIAIREVLKDFYSVLKPLDVYLKFVFFTGVSKFSKVSLFSGLNQLMDITLSKQYSAICGYTQQELEEVFKDYLEGEDLEIIKEWYNGYSWLGESVYNPFDVLLYLREKMLHPYWFETGTPTFLIKLLIEKKFYIPQLEDLCASDHLIGSFDVDFIEPENLLFQTGYLTIKSYKQMLKGIVYNLSYPNKEVKISLNDYLGRYLTNLSSEKERLTQKLEEILGNGEIIEFKEILQSLFSSIPYEWYKKNEISGYEGYYASVVYSFLAGAGFNIIAEDYTSEGRIDLTIQYKEKCYIIEFKVIEIERKNQRGALEQLEIKNYADKYKSRYNTIYLVGIEFIKEKKNIIDFLWKEIKN